MLPARLYKLPIALFLVGCLNPDTPHAVGEGDVLNAKAQTGPNQTAASEPRSSSEDASPTPQEPPCSSAGPECTCIDSDAEQICFPSFEGSAEPLSESVRQEMTGASWKEGCPVSLDELRLLHVTFWNFEGSQTTGELVMAATVADAILDVFRQLHDAQFPIERMERIDVYDADDVASMTANNTSGYNCRKIGRSQVWAEHALGTAIDLNPFQNPWIRNGIVDPPTATAYVDRTNVRTGMVVEGSPAIAAFRSAGWHWGGHWHSLKDYQHFSKGGR